MGYLFFEAFKDGKHGTARIRFGGRLKGLPLLEKTRGCVIGKHGSRDFHSWFCEAIYLAQQLVFRAFGLIRLHLLAVYPFEQPDNRSIKKRIEPISPCFDYLSVKINSAFIQIFYDSQTLLKFF